MAGMSARRGECDGRPGDTDGALPQDAEGVLSTDKEFTFVRTCACCREAQVAGDGSDEAARRLNRVLTNDPGIGVARHVDAGYSEAALTARKKAIHIPMLSSD